MVEHEFQLRLLHPRLWLSWLAIAVWWLLVQCLPYRFQLFLGNRLGDLILLIGGSRVHIAKVNIARCFPELSEREQKKLLRDNIRSTAMGIFESGAAWFWPDWRLKKHFILSGREHLEYVQQQGRGVLFLGIHFTPIEIGAAYVNTAFSIDGFYRPHKNPVYEYVQAKGRIRRNPHSQVIPNGDVRGIVRALRAGRAVNYAPDQDYGLRRSVFAPFFGVSAATVKAPAQLAKAGKAEIVPWVTRRLQDGSYEVKIYPAITGLLGSTEEENAVAINTFVEARVREYPEQYLWVHRRFKTRPDGEEGFY